MSEHAAREKREATTHREIELCLQNADRLALDGHVQAVGRLALKRRSHGAEIVVVLLQGRLEKFARLRKVKDRVYE
jgi:hypothetical protein